MIAVLFARVDSIYKKIDGLDVWDEKRDALNWEGGNPVIAHPPCRAWGRLRGLAKPRPFEKDLAVWAVAMVRRYGGVLEHPAGSTLWAAAGLPKPGQRDEFGGWTLPIYQSNFGHRAEKATFIYIVGCEPGELPEIPFSMGNATHVISSSGRRSDGSRLVKGDLGWRPSVSKSEREHTPIELAMWLVKVAQLTKQE